LFIFFIMSTCITCTCSRQSRGDFHAGQR
jgi:hypothetical protein